MGDIRVNDAVIDVEKLEPIAPGSQMFRFPNPQQMSPETYCSKSFACFVEDIRIVATVELLSPDAPDADEYAQRPRTRRHKPGHWDDTYKLSREDVLKIAGMLNYENDLEETENRLSTEGAVAEEAALQVAAAADTAGIQDDIEPDSDSDNED